MSNRVLVLCDERDGEIAAAMRAALEGRGHAVVIEACDAAEETLGVRAREALAAATNVIVIVREGGRGNRILHAAEDEARAGTNIVSLIADASPDGAVSARTHSRIDTLGDTLSSRPAGAPRERGAPPNLARVLAAVVALAALAGLVAWLQCSPAPPPAGPYVVLTGMLSSSGWIVQFHLREDASFLEYKLSTDRDFVSTGDAGPGSGPDRDQPHAKTFAVFPALHGRVPIQVRYRTAGGASRGPYEAVFDTTAEAVSSVKQILAEVPGWISFRLFAGRRLCYFSTLLTYKYALRSIRYGVDTALPDRTLRFTPRDVPGIDNEDQILIDLPEDASSVTVELVFLDGTTSEKKRFPVRY